MNLTLLKENPVLWVTTASISDIEHILENASDIYYNSSETYISDYIYDILIDKYKVLTQNIGKCIKVGADIKGAKVELPVYMGSMDKEKSINGIEKWCKKKSNNVYIISPKVDGSSALLVIDLKKKIYKMYSRGNGTFGKNISHLLDILDIVPKINKYIESNGETKNHNQIIVRGELIIQKKEYEKIADLYTSARSYVNGLNNTKIIEQSTINQCKLQFLSFELIEPRVKPNEQFKFIKDIGLDLVDNKIVEYNTLLSSNYLDNLLIYYRKNYEYDIDGIILTSNMLSTVNTSGNPNYSIAYKKNCVGKIVTVQTIEWNISKHNVLIPTIIFNKIRLGSADVSRATGFSAKYIFMNSLGKGAKLRVVLSGEVIPYIEEIISPSDYPMMPKCNYKWNKNRVHIISLDSSKELEIKQIIVFIKSINIDYLSEGIVTLLYDAGYNTIPKILQISIDELLEIPRIEQKMADKLYNSINTITQNPINIINIMEGSLIFGTGFGYKKFDKVVKKHPHFLTEDLSIDTLNRIDGWSFKTSEQFKDNLDNFKEFLKIIQFLNIVINPHKTNMNNSVDYPEFENKKICMSGSRDKKIIDFLESNNGIIVNTISKDTSLLLVKDMNNITSKISNAQKLHINIMSLNNFYSKYNL